MKNLAILVNGRISKNRIKNTCDWKKRKAARAIVSNNKKEIALLWVGNYHFYKIPGGGIEKGENIKKALKREIMEEVGVKIKTIKLLGEIEEYWTENKYFQKSYCFTAKVKNKIKNPEFTEEEKSASFELHWLTKQKAIEAMKKEYITEEGHKAINFRDKLIIEKTMKTKY